MTVLYTTIPVEQPILATRSKESKITLYSFTSLQGKALTLTQIEGTRKYSILPRVIKGSRIGRLPTGETTQASYELAVDEQIVNTGIGSFGIGYNPTIHVVEQKEIRRWPRDWHGDNIKK